MDTIILLLFLFTLFLFWKKPDKWYGLLMFGLSALALVLLFMYHATSTLSINL
ncbi:MAG: hypothetical protein KBA02_03255 [Paludibacteraceae bacterium]|nr:hypothetical protein [Paludibacteraceae bacterium]